jgi:GTPase SAR1 family protein
MPSELKITMLGHRGVGKTSILTAMYEQFESTIGETGLQLTPDAESSALLSKRLGELKALLNDFEAAGGLEGTEEPQSFKFGLGKLGGKPNIQLIFQDFPGGYLQNHLELATNGQVWLWNKNPDNTFNGKPFPKKHKGQVLSVGISQDGKTIVSSGADGTVWVWDRNGKVKEINTTKSNK